MQMQKLFTQDPLKVAQQQLYTPTCALTPTLSGSKLPHPKSNSQGCASVELRRQCAEHLPLIPLPLRTFQISKPQPPQPLEVAQTLLGSRK
jgi:hypothetical protein